MGDSALASSAAPGLAPAQCGCSPGAAIQPAKCYQHTELPPQSPPCSIQACAGRATGWIPAQYPAISILRHQLCCTRHAFETSVAALPTTLTIQLKTSGPKCFRDTTLKIQTKKAPTQHLTASLLHMALIPATVHTRTRCLFVKTNTDHCSGQHTYTHMLLVNTPTRHTHSLGCSTSPKMPVQGTHCHGCRLHTTYHLVNKMRHAYTSQQNAACWHHKNHLQAAAAPHSQPPICPVMKEAPRVGPFYLSNHCACTSA